MKKKDNAVFNFILKETGIKISPFLQSLISNPRKIETLNNIALKQVVEEFAPICKKYKHVLDGSKELSQILEFKFLLIYRLHNKPDLLKILDEWKWFPSFADSSTGCN